MPDITKCQGKDCPFKNHCYRFVSEANDLYQSYFSELPYNKETDSCAYLWEYKHD